jgi:hypothetical protein
VEVVGTSQDWGGCQIQLVENAEAEGHRTGGSVVVVGGSNFHEKLSRLVPGVSAPVRRSHNEHVRTPFASAAGDVRLGSNGGSTSEAAECDGGAGARVGWCAGSDHGTCAADLRG